VPTYGYKCTQCEYQFQVFQSMKDDPVATCPECQGAVTRLLYPVGIVFKGSGWYITDSRKPEKADAAEGNGAKTSGEATGGQTTSETSKKETAPSAS